MNSSEANAKLSLHRERYSPPEISFGEFGGGSDGAAEREHLLTALKRLIGGVAERSGLLDAADPLIHFIRTNADALALVLPPTVDAISCLEELPRRKWATVLSSVAASFPVLSPNPRSSLDRRLDFLARSMGLGEVDRAVLGILARQSIYRTWQRLVEKVGMGGPLSRVSAVALMIGQSNDATYRAYSDKGSLKAKGLAEEDRCGGGLNLDLHDFVKRFVASDAVTDREMMAELMPLAPRATLDAQSYAHMGADLVRACRLVAHALQSGERANILLYGVPGTGKTEFARLLADSAVAPSVSVGEADDEGFEPTRLERLAHLGVCRRLIADLGKAVLVIDEAEDLFVSGVESRGSKLWLNKLVEEGHGPHVWIVNDPHLLGEPVIRRMDMAVRFDIPPPAARRRMAERMLSSREASPAIDEMSRARLVTELADLNTSPAILSAAMRTDAMLGDDTDGLVELARALTDASGRDRSPAQASCGSAFDPALSVANCDLVMLADKLVGSTQNWSMLLSGPPGTGKSAYARYLADRAGLDLLCVSGSDMLGTFVGETEKQIATAFSQAERSGSLLLIDEVDSFLSHRNVAQRNWEVTMTNEMLRQMERCHVRFVATTNRAQQLDPASARRFLLHAEFSTLDESRARRLFESSFTIAAPESLRQVCGLTPGDFHQMRQRTNLLGQALPERLVEWLADAVLARDGGTGPIGF